MQKRVLEADEARRSDEQSRTLLLDKQIRARESLEHELRTANSEIEHLRVEAAQSKRSIQTEATEREKRLTKTARDFVDLVDAQLTECLTPVTMEIGLASSSSSSGGGSSGGFAAMDESPAHVMLRRAMARLDTDDIISSTATTSSNSSSSRSTTENNNSTSPMFPQRTVLHKLYQLQKMRGAFEHVVRNAENKYIQKIRVLEGHVTSKTKQLDRLVGKQRMLLEHQNSTSVEESNVRIQMEEKRQELMDSAHEIDSLRGMNMTVEAEKVKAEKELATQKKMNEDLALQLSKAATIMESLRDSQHQLQKKMKHREQQMSLYTNELRTKSEKHLQQSHSHEQQQQSQQQQSQQQPLSEVNQYRDGSLRASIQNQVRETQRTIEQSSAGLLDQERSRYLSASDLNVSQNGVHRSGGTKNKGRARKVRIHRSGSVDIRFDPDQMSAMANAAAAAEQNQNNHGALQQQQQQQQQQTIDPKLVHLHDQLHEKQDGLQQLLHEIRSLVGTTETFLDHFFKFKGGGSLREREPLVSRSSGHFSQTSDSPSVSVLQRDVMTLLDSNARLALQLQALGKDLQTVYRRFKAMEINLAQQAVSETNRENRNFVGRPRAPSADVGPIVEQMQKWGRDLQNAASQLSTSQIRA